MDNSKKSPEEMIANLCLDPGFVLVPQDRYEELVRAETERDVLESTIMGENKYSAETVMMAIRKARSRLPGGIPERKGDEDAQ